MAQYKQYKTEFNDYQMAIFNTLDLNGYKRFNLMSVYSYLIKHSIDKLVSKSLSKLYAMYIRYHKKVDSMDESISKSYFCGLINELVDLKLLAKDNRKVFILDSPVDKKVDEKVDKNNSAPSVEESGVTEDSVATEIQSSKNIYNNNNIYNTSSEDVADIHNDFDLEFESADSKVFVPNGSKVLATKEQLKEIAEDLYKTLKIRSNHIKTEVLNVICAYDERIYLQSARSYLKAVILDKKARREIEREDFVKKVAIGKNLVRASKHKNVSGDSFGNYTSNNSRRFNAIEESSEYSFGNYTSNNSSRMARVNHTDKQVREFESLENDLLGWY